MKAGKLPSDVLERLLTRLPSHPRLLLGPGVGRDAAAIDMGNGRVLVAKADPVTFATDQVGRYVVNVNANDIACLGARPLWFLATALLPEGASASLAEEIFDQVRVACDELGVTPVGGHTEVTLGLDRPLIAGAMLGEVDADALVRPDGAREGDHIIMTKAIAIEGTALLARDAPDALRKAGVAVEVVEAAAQLLADPGISIVPEAMAACATTRVHALHDATEGGLATALAELGKASGLSVRVRRDDVTVRAETSVMCEGLALNPLGLLASGTLLIVVASDDCNAVCAAVHNAGVSATCVGEVVAPGQDVIIDRDGPAPLPRFERDELARFLEAIQQHNA